MRRINRFLQHNVVHGIGILALVGVGMIWAIDVFKETSSSDDLPVLYDLSLAYLTGWFFHLLVVVMPERRRVKNLLETLRGPLMIVANNGVDLIRDLEYIGRCPEGAPTQEHVTKVCKTIGWWGGQRFVKQRLSVAREAFASVEPYLTVLPIELTAALQRAEQVFLMQQLEVPRALDTNFGLHDFDTERLRNSGALWDPKTPQGPPKRFTFEGFSGSVLEYHDLTEAVRATLPKYLKKDRNVAAPEHVEFFAVGKWNTPDYPYASYPTTAFTDDWVGPLPEDRPEWWRGISDEDSGSVRPS
jgi:hypothetical protein